MVEIVDNTLVENLELTNKRVKVDINPKGAFIQTLMIDGKEVIYCPRNDKPGRGGIPILGPTPGPIKDNTWEKLYPNMPSHGTDRKILWLVSETNDDEIILKRTIGPKEFLFAGEIKISIKILDNGVSISKTITNFEEKPREIGHGFHPYFTVNSNTTYSPDELNDIYPLTSGKSEVIKPGIKTISIKSGKDSYTLEASPTPIQTVVWSDNTDLYECIEPWWAEVGRGDVIGPNESKSYTFVISKDN